MYSTNVLLLFRAKTQKQRLLPFCISPRQIFIYVFRDSKYKPMNLMCPLITIHNTQTKRDGQGYLFMSPASPPRSISFPRF